MNVSESCFWDISVPSESCFLFDFEKNFDYWKVYYWYVDNWDVGFYICGIYLVSIYIGLRLMKSRQPFQLRVPLILWNLSLALLSIIAIVRMLPVFVSMLLDVGFNKSLCERWSIERKRSVAYWANLFIILKVVELGDTVFIILRKTPLIFLHWYHHISVLLFTWSSSAYPSAMQPYFYLTNLIMHAFVYSYYALKALQVRIPRQVNITITLMQILEMAFGVYATYSAYWEKARNPDCCVFDQAIKLAVLVYSLYFVMFTNFFYKSYIRNKGELFDEKGAFKKLS